VRADRVAGVAGRRRAEVDGAARHHAERSGAGVSDHREDAERPELAQGEGPCALRPEPEPWRAGARRHRRRRERKRESGPAAPGDPVSRDHERGRKPAGPGRRLQGLAGSVGEAGDSPQLRGRPRSRAAAVDRQDRDLAGAARRGRPAAGGHARRRRARRALSDRVVCRREEADPPGDVRRGPIRQADRAGQGREGSRGAQGGHPQSRPDEKRRHGRHADVHLRLGFVARRAQGGRQRPLPAEQCKGARRPRARREERRDEEGDRLQALDHEVDRSHRLSPGAAEMNAQRGRGANRDHGEGSATENTKTRRKNMYGLCVSVSPWLIPSVSSRALSVLLILLLPSLAGAQGRISNAKTETRSAAQGLDREVRAAAARGGVLWIGYRTPMVAGPRQMCCFDTIPDAGTCCGMCRLESGGGVSMSTGDSRDFRGSRITLEPPTELLVLARVENNAIVRLRTFTPDCDIDATGMPLVWLNDVKPDDSLAWLASLVSSSPDGGEGRERVSKTAIAAIALHNVPAADRTLESFVAPTRPEWLRSDTAFWLGSARGEAGARLLTRMIAQDPSDKVREKTTFGRTVSKAPAALTT